MFQVPFLRPPPPKVDIHTSNGRRGLLAELVVNRRLWQDYINYLGAVDCKLRNGESFSGVDHGTLNKMINEAILEHYSLDKGVYYALYEDPWPTEGHEEEEEEGEGQERMKAREAPTSLSSLLKEPKGKELLLSEAVRCRQAWCIYSNSLSHLDSRSDLLRQAVKERCDIEDFIDKLLETMYCSAETDGGSSDHGESETEEGAPPRKKRFK